MTQHETLMQILLFFALVAEGGVTRLLYSGVLKMQKKHGKVFAALTDVLTAVLGGCAMLLTCFLLSDGVRVFHAVFFIGGIALTHLLLTPSRKKKRRRIDGTDEDALPALTTPTEDERASDASAPHPSSGSSDRA